MTLVFLGWQDEAAAEAIAAAAFARRRRARAALRAGRGPPAAAARPAPVRARPRGRGRPGSALQARVSEALEAGGWYRPEKRPFWPHLTLARVKRGERRVAPLPDAPAPPAVRGARR